MSNPVTKKLRVLWLVLGVLIPQVAILSPSLFGDKVMLPAEILPRVVPALYPVDGRSGSVGEPSWLNNSDMILQYEPFRRYALDELSQGRLPLWNPHNYCGAPFLGNGQSSVFSPYRLIEFLSADPAVLVWSQLAKSLVAGLGMYFFLRRGLRVSFRGAAAGAWIYPLTGYLTIWAGSPMAAGATWMPWVLFATATSLRTPGIFGPALLAAFTCCCAFAGHIQIIGHTLLLSGLYAVFHFVRQYRNPQNRRSAGFALARCTLGWALGLALAAPQLFPLVEYVLESNRWQLRTSGVVEREASGMLAVLDVIQPWLCGERAPGSVFILKHSRQESSATAYAGLLLLLVAAPLAWRARRWRPVAFFFAGVAVLGVSQVLAIPLLGWLVERPPLGVLSSNRMTCLTALAITVLGALGVDAIGRRNARSPFPWTIPLAFMTLLAGVLIWYASTLRPRLSMALRSDPTANIDQVHASFLHQCYIAMGLLLLAAVLYVWLAARDRSARVRLLGAWCLIGACVFEVALLSAPSIPQATRASYPTTTPFSQALAQLPPGRFVDGGGLQDNLNLFFKLDSVLGYDAVDPAHITQMLLSASRDPSRNRTYSALVGYVPNMQGGVLDSLAFRYFFTAVELPLGAPKVSGPHFYVYENPAYVPRVHIPRRIATVPLEAQLPLLNAPAFKPAELGLIASQTPVGYSEVRGTAEIVSQTPTNIRIEADMKTPGVVVLADTWFPGWIATVEGKPAPILRANYAVRGVEVPVGKSVIEFRYQPMSFRIGIGFMAAALLVMLGLAVRQRRMQSS